MGGVSPETCWSSYKYEITKFDTLLHLVGFSLWPVHSVSYNTDHTGLLTQRTNASNETCNCRSSDGNITALHCITWLLYTADSFLNNTLHIYGTVDSRFSESRLFEFPFCPSRCVEVKVDSMMGTNNSVEVCCLCARECLSGFTGMRRITTFRSTTDRMYDGGPIR
jgi:hypothetical protein